MRCTVHEATMRVSTLKASPSIKQRQKLLTRLRRWNTLNVPLEVRARQNCQKVYHVVARRRINSIDTGTTASKSSHDCAVGTNLLSSEGTCEAKHMQKSSHTLHFQFDYTTPSMLNAVAYHGRRHLFR